MCVYYIYIRKKSALFRNRYHEIFMAIHITKFNLLSLLLLTVTPVRGK